MQLTDIYTTNEFKDCWIYIEMPPENQLEILSLLYSLNLCGDLRDN